MRPSLPAIALSYLRIGCGAFGGGVASFPVFVAELSRRRGWLSESDLAGDFALAQSVPGVIIVNFAVLSARRLRGVPGALLAAFSVVLPAFLLVLALASLLARRFPPLASAAVAGLRPAVLALLVSAAISLFRRTPRGLLPAALALAAAAATLFRAPIPLVLALAAAAGVLLPLRTRASE